MKKKTARILVAFSLIAAAFWIFYFPYSRTRLFRPVPINASFISEHRDLAGRWKTAVKNPVIANLLTSVLGDVDLQAVRRGDGRAGRRSTP